MRNRPGSSHAGVIVVVVLASAAWLGKASRVSAQVEISTTYGDEDIQSVQVSTLRDGTKTRRTESGADGWAQIESDAFPRGTRIRVYRKSPPRLADNEVVFVGPGEELEGRYVDLGEFVWRDGTTLDIDMAVGILEVTPPSVATRGWRVGGGVDVAGYTNFEDVACDQPDLVDCEGDSGGYGVIGSIEYLRDAWGYGVEFGYANAPDVRQTNAGGRVETETDVLSVTPTVSYRLRPSLAIVLGAMWLYNMTELTRAGVTRETIERNEGNLNAYVGTRFGIPLAGSLSLELGLGVSTSLSDEDADSHIVLGTARLTAPIGSRERPADVRRDSDGDGVPDRDDACPGTERGATVDGRGCPSDSDNDGVYDGLDACPSTPAGVQVDETGCPLEASIGAESSNIGAGR